VRIEVLPKTRAQNGLPRNTRTPCGWQTGTNSVDRNHPEVSSQIQGQALAKLADLSLQSCSAIAAMDFFVVPTATFRLLYVLVVMNHERRKVVHFNITIHPQPPGPRSR
jgi:hypothetical protein